MGRAMKIYVFGDQTNSFEASLKRLFQIKENPLLASFLERTHHRLRLEIGHLSAAERENFPRFTSLGDLLARYYESGDNPALESAFTTINQLGFFINHYGEGSREYPSSSDSLIVGICTGLLAASAVSSAKSIPELIPIAIEAVMIAFWTGLRAFNVRHHVDCHSTTLSWSVVVPGLQEQTALSMLKAFNESENLPLSSRTYLSSISPSSVTVSGPPQIVKQFLASNYATGLKPIRVTINAPYHAGHLYDESDIDTILEKCSLQNLGNCEPGIPIISSTTGNLISPSHYALLFRSALAEILLQPIRWDRVIRGCASMVKSSGVSRCDIFSIASSTSQSLLSSLREVGNIGVDLKNDIMDGIKKFGISTGRQEQSKIAITGLSGRFPEAANTDQFWDLLYQGLDVHREVPPDRFDIKTHYDPTGKRKNTSQTPYGCFINEPGLFDARFFNMSPKEAAQSDPGQRLALLTACEALEMAGFVPDRTPSTQRDRVGIFYGMTSDDWREVNSGQNVGTYFIPGGNRAFTPGRINYHFKFSGPSVSVDTACSSSLAAIHMACNSLWRNDCDTAIAGGTNVMTNPDNFTGLDKGHFLSRTGNCKTFDDSADGYCRADAVGTVVLKRLEDALADGDPIQAIIAGAYTNHSAESDSITRPHIGAQSFIFGKVLNDAGVDPLDVSYIEMHGTGTQAGDMVEMTSVLDIFASGRSKRSTERPLYLGSAKSNIGHAESASGVASLIKVLLMMKENEIPPHCGIKTQINHRFPKDLRERGIRIPLQPTPWLRNGGTRRAFLNNFSAAGGNTALLLEDAPVAHRPESNDPRSIHMVAVSARTIASLKKNLQSLIALLEKEKTLSLSDLSYTTTARRIHHEYRVIVKGSNITSIKAELEKAMSRSDLGLTPTRKVAFAFTGQGSQYIGMGKQLFQNFSQFRSDILRFDRIGMRFGFPSIQPIVDGTVSEQDLSPLVTQLGLTCLQMALARLWISWGVQPSIVVGHSLGEYAALNISGVLSIHDTIYLVGTRAQILQEKCTAGSHSMLAVKAPISQIASMSQNRTFEYACINGPEQVVLSGSRSEIEGMLEVLKGSGIKCTMLAVPYAFHSSQVEPILQEFESAARGVKFQKPSIPIISPLLSEVITGDEIDATYLSRHCREVVDFEGGLNAAERSGRAGNTIWLEIGPNPVVSGMIKASLGPTAPTITSLRRDDTWGALTEGLSTLHSEGINIQWSEYHRDFDHTVLQLPAYNWDYKNYWIQYVHDWCLTKGDPPSITSAPQPPKFPPLSTTTVHKVVDFQVEDNRTSVVVESDLSNANLTAVLQGHMVNGAALCPSSVYADIALTLGEYMRSTKPDATNAGMDICNMVVQNPLIASNSGSPQLFRVSATADWVGKTAVVNYYSITPEGKKTIDHAKCTIKYANSDMWLEEWNRNAYLVRSRMGKLLQGVDDGNGQSHRIKRGLAYKLFSSLVEYDQNFRGMEEVVLDSAELEATATVVFQAPKANFHTSPYWIDSLGHISGFVMNANDAVDSKAQVFINHGWESMRCAKILSSDKTYKTYVKMQQVAGKDQLFSGDVYIFEGEQIIGVNRGVQFQGVPRRVLDLVLSPAGAAQQVGRAVAQSVPKPPPTSHRASKPKSASIRQVKAQTLKQSSTLARVLDIIATEIGVDVSDLSEDSVFSDFGVDSLLSLTVLGRFREELDLDAPSTLFFDYPRVGDLNRFFSCNSSPASDSPEATPETSEPEDFEESIATSSQTSLDTEDDEFADPKLKITDEGEDGPASLFSSTLADEIGVSVEEIRNCPDFAELGMDSLMSLTVLGLLRERLGIDLPSSFFIEHSTLESAEAALGLKPKPNQPTMRKSAPTSTQRKTIGRAVPSASSILLQGNSKTSLKTLFLFPDGSGSSTSYATLPNVGPEVAIVGLNCPYMKTPEDMKCTLHELNTSYMAEIRRRQPNGPYHLGGWSAGGICAYDVAQRLLQLGEGVESLILIDSPFPIGLTKLPPRLYHFFNSISLFGTGNKPPPDWLLPHFLAFVDALDSYKTKPFQPGTAPKTHLILARDGVYKSAGGARLEPQDDDTREMNWLLNDREDLGPNGWDRLVGAENIKVEVMDGANHFTMMEGEKGKFLRDIIKKALD